MAYKYENVRPQLFTEEGQSLFLKIRDKAFFLLQNSGAFMAEKAWKGCTGDTDMMLACLDRMVELKEIVEVTDLHVWGQHRIFRKVGQ
jgi:hypothetical protein